jgi:hypothetical protein
MEFNPNAPAEMISDGFPLVVVDSASKTQTSFRRSAAERLATAQQRVREHRCTESGSYQAFCADVYYKDFAGPDTSEHWWDVLHAIVGLIHVPHHFTMRVFSYDRMKGEGLTTGEGVNEIRVPIAELRRAINARITELELAQHLTWEYMIESHTVAEDSAFYSLPFEQRIQRFRDGASRDRPPNSEVHEHDGDEQRLIAAQEVQNG